MAERDVHGDVKVPEFAMERAGAAGLMAKAKPVENKTLAISLLKENERNYNRHSESQLADLRASLQQFGQVRSVVVQANGGKHYTILAGHGIIEAARQEGYKELRADVVPASWSKTKALAYLAADNELARHGDPDQDQLAAIVKEVMDAEGETLARLAAGEQIALDALLVRANPKEETADVGALVDKAAELQKKWKVERGDVWEIGRHKLMCGDSTSAEDVAYLMAGDLAQMVMADPPYNVKYTGGSTNQNARADSYKDQMSDAQYTEWLKEVLDNAYRHSDDKTALHLWFASAKMRSVIDSIEGAGWELRNLIIWNKLKAHYGALGAQYKHRSEPMWYAFKRGHAPRWFGESNECTVWDEEQPRVNELHPTMKPIPLYVRSVSNHTQANDIVLEMFNGSGTTLVACEQTGRQGRALDFESKFVAVTLERLSLLGLTPRRIEHNGKKQGKTAA